MRMGQRAAGQDPHQVLTLLRQAGKDGAEVEHNPSTSSSIWDPLTGARACRASYDMAKLASASPVTAAVVVREMRRRPVTAGREKPFEPARG